MAAEMLAAYYGYGYDSELMFQGLEIAEHPSFEEHRNRYHVLFLNIQDFLSRAGNVKDTVLCLQEVEYEFAAAMQGAGWDEVIRAIESSEELPDATLRKDEETVARALDESHREAASVLAYNNENLLSCAISLAYFSART